MISASADGYYHGQRGSQTLDLEALKSMPKRS